MFLERGRIAVAGAAQDRILEEEAAYLMEQAGVGAL